MLSSFGVMFAFFIIYKLSFSYIPKMYTSEITLAILRLNLNLRFLFNCIYSQLNVLYGKPVVCDH